MQVKQLTEGYTTRKKKVPRLKTEMPQSECMENQRVPEKRNSSY